MTRKVKATLFIQEDKRAKIQKSGMSLEEYFNKIYDAYEKLHLDTWKDGCFMIEYFRVCLLRAETLNLLLDNIEDERQYEIGRELSEKLLTLLKEGFLHELGQEDVVSTNIIEYLNNYSGWGFIIRENNSIIIKMPVFKNPNFIKGYLEGILNLKLTLLESYPDRTSFKIINQ